MNIKPMHVMILQMLVDGYNQKEIAAKLKTTTTAINGRIKYARELSGAKNIHQLVARAIQNNLIN